MAIKREREQLEEKMDNGKEFLKIENEFRRSNIQVRRILKGDNRGKLSENKEYKLT